MTAKQATFLCYEGREALFGGAAGGGKSVALLMAALQWVDQPGYGALILRRTYKQLAKSDSILSKAKEWLLPLRSLGLKYNSNDYKFTFPSGSTLEFGHMDTEDAKYNYQGGTWQFVGPDETTQFTGEMISYPRTRMRRSVDSPIPIRWRGASNPGGPGHDYIKSRYIKDAEGKNPATPDRRFFPAKIDDNPNLDREDYVKQLREAGVDPLTLAQLLDGDWDAVPGGRFKREWFSNRWHYRGKYVVIDGQEFDPYDVKRFCTVDTAASISTEADYTVVATWCMSPWGHLVWLGCDRFRAEIPDICPRIAKAVQRWHPVWVGIEAIASNVGVLQLAYRHTTPMIPASPVDKGQRDKLVHASLAITFASTGRIIMPAPGVEPTFPEDDILSELVRFTGDDKKDDHDDIVDALSYAAEYAFDAPPEVLRLADLPTVWGTSL